MQKHNSDVKMCHDPNSVCAIPNQMTDSSEFRDRNDD